MTQVTQLREGCRARRRRPQRAVLYAIFYGLLYPTLQNGRRVPANWMRRGGFQTKRVSSQRVGCTYAVSSQHVKICPGSKNGPHQTHYRIEGWCQENTHALSCHRAGRGIRGKRKKKKEKKVRLSAVRLLESFSRPSRSLKGVKSRNFEKHHARTPISFFLSLQQPSPEKSLFLIEDGR